MDESRRLVSPIAILVAVGLSATALLAARSADAAPVKGGAVAAGKRPEHMGPLQRESSWTAAGRLGRVRMKQGDCAAAIDSFDESLKGSIDVTVQRDRGLCHEKLEHPYPAIADYRAYLTENPDAPDSEDIRTRLSRLQDAVAENAPRDEKAAAAANASFALRAGRDPNAGNLPTATPPPRSGTLDAVQAWETEEAQANGSPLRRGKGFVLGAYLNFRRYSDSELAWGQTVGAGFRYSLSRTSTILSEFGYSSVNGQSASTSMGGIGVFLGYEARFALNPYMTDAIYLGGGLGYEHLRRQSSGQVFATVLPRARLGYRHVFGPALGFEAGVDGGYAFFSALDAPMNIDGSSGSVVIALNVALVLGF